MLWAVANTLTVFAIRNVGLSIAFPLWNTNSLVGLFWGWLLFNELRGSGASQWLKVLGGAAAIVVGRLPARLRHLAPGRPAPAGERHARHLAALGAGLLWGTMYIPYRKAYISGMNPLSFVTVFTFGELGTVFALALVFDGGFDNVVARPRRRRGRSCSGSSSAASAGCWATSSSSTPPSTSASAAASRCPTPTSSGAWPGALLVFGELAGQSADSPDCS